MTHFVRTKPIRSCEMGNKLCLKDTVRHISSNDKDGFTINYGRGTVLGIDKILNRAMVYWFTTKKKSFTYIDKLVKVGRYYG